MTASEIHVVAAALVDDAGRVLVNRRPDGKPLAGYWEFPGGKLEAGEDPLEGLRREIEEELGVALGRARPLTRIRHRYPDRRVLLDVWRAEVWDGEVRPMDGQELRWLSVDQLRTLRLLPADGPIVQAIALPDHYVITPPDQPADRTLQGLDELIAGGRRLFQFRRTAPDEALFKDMAGRVRAAGGRLLLNGEPGEAQRLGAHGVHLNGSRAARLDARPLDDGLVGVSCHDQAELAHAEALGADFAVLGPVLATPSHPDAAPMGWARFKELVDRANLPVYALGGVGPDDLDAAWDHGAQGVAGISAFWG